MMTYQSDSLSFNITEIKVELSKLGSEKYISRSQAKRILLGLEKFDIVIPYFSCKILRSAVFINPGLLYVVCRNSFYCQMRCAMQQKKIIFDQSAKSRCASSR